MGTYHVGGICLVPTAALVVKTEGSRVEHVMEMEGWGVRCMEQLE